MSEEAVLFSRLTGDAAIAAIVGTRVYPVEAPEGAALPHLVYRLVSDGRVRAMTTDTGVTPRRVQITAKAAGFDGVAALANAVKAALKDWRDPASNPVVMGCAFETAFDGFDERRSPAAGGAGSYRRNLDFLITYRS
ncbi:MAG: DUF3168 domain-containing protein [Oceanicaulis sp.]